MRRRDTAAIVGVGSSEYGWRLGRDPVDLILDASRQAIAEAGLRIQDIDGIVVESSYTPVVAPADRVAFELGHSGAFVSLTAGIGGAGVVYSLALAQMLIADSRCRHILCYFGSDFGSSPGGPYTFPVGIQTKRSYEAPHGWFGQPVYFAAMAERYAFEFGLSEKATAAVAIAARHGAMLTDDAVLQKPLTFEGYEEEPLIAGRLRRPDCSVVADGATAWVVSRTSDAGDVDQPGVCILGVGHGYEAGTSSDTYFTQRGRFVSTPCIESSGEAFGRAGLTPEDVDVAEIYDCFTISTIVQLEDAGFCGKGDGAKFVEAGEIDLTGALPTNTHGGLLAHSYNLGAEHVVEAVRQLRGTAGPRQVRDAEIAFVSGMGLPEHASAVLGRAS